jgi:hypothetical protein
MFTQVSSLFASTLGGYMLFWKKKKQQNNNKKQSSEKQQNENIKTETTQACKTGRENIIHRK